MGVGATIALVIVIVLVVAALAVAGTIIMRRVALRRRFGAEYDRLAEDVGPRRAEAELTQRQRRIAQLNIRPLSADQRARYDAEWTAAQERFIDSPAEAAQGATALITAVAADRGYPAGDHDQLLADLSVHHARRLEAYRRAQQAAGRDGATTEDLRHALLAYRALFYDLLDAEDSPAGRHAAGAGPNGGGAAVAGMPVAGGPTADATREDAGQEDRAAAESTRKE